MRNIRIRQLIFLRQTTKRSCSQFRGRGRNSKNNTQTPKKAIQLILHGIRFVSEHLEPLENGATTSAGKEVLILRDITKIMSPFLVASLFSAIFIKLIDCFMIFVLTCHKSVTILIKFFSCILLCFSLTSCLDISPKAFRIKPAVCKILMIDVTTKEIVNTTLNDEISTSTISCRPKK